MRFLTVSCDAKASAKPPIDAPAKIVAASTPKSNNNLKVPIIKIRTVVKFFRIGVN